MTTNLKTLPHSQVFQPRQHLQTVCDHGTELGDCQGQELSRPPLPSSGCLVHLLLSVPVIRDYEMSIAQDQSLLIFKPSTGNKGRLYGAVCVRMSEKKRQRNGQHSLIFSNCSSGDGGYEDEDGAMRLRRTSPSITARSSDQS